MVTLADLKDQIFRNTNNLYTDQEQMRLLVNNALSDLANEAKLQKVTMLAVTSGTAAYNLPTDYKSPYALMEGTIDNAQYVYSLIDMTSPQYGYALYNGQIWLKPTPTADKTLNFYYYAYHPDLNADTDAIIFDDRYANIISAYASAMILSLPGMPEVNQALIQRYFSIWDDGKASFAQDMQKKVKQTSVRKVNVW